MGRPRKNPLIAASQVPAADMIQDETKPKEYPPRQDPMELVGIAGEVAEDFFYVRNSRFPNAAAHFPTEPDKRTVDKYFAGAKGGPLYIDEPTTKRDISICKEKAVAMAKEGVRYAYIGPDMGIEDVKAQLAPAEDMRGVA